jgi:hypothetical protein
MSPAITLLAATLPTAILETILTHLAGLFLTGAAGDPIAARRAAAQMLAAYHPNTEEELRLAGNIVGFSFHALEALGQAAAPDMPITRVLRLRGSAVSLNREASKAERRLIQLQTARRQCIQAQTQPAEPEAKAEKAVALIQDTRKIAIAAKANGQSWAQAYEEHQRDIRIAARIKKNAAKVGALPNAAIPHHPQTVAATI